MLSDHVNVPVEEMIDVRFWDNLVRELGGTGNGIRFIPGEHLAENGIASEGGTWNGVVVSAYSDFGIHEQEKSHPNADLHKLSYRVNWPEALAAREDYANIQIGPACRRERCNPRDKYSVKIDSWTDCTFPCLPKWIRKWYSVNLNIDHPQAECIPFGLNDHGPGLGMLPDFRGREKKHLLYVNFQDNTVERLHLKEFFKSRGMKATIRDNANLPIDQFLSEVAEHKFVLSPFGNGLDCYRNYEAMYLGSVPILQQSTFASNLGKLGLPFVTVPNMIISQSDSQCTQMLEHIWGQLNTLDYSYQALTKSYWRDKISKDIES